MTTPVNFEEYASQAIAQLNKSGAFLTAGTGDKVNTMTIGWGAIGRIWSKPMFTVLVRGNRHTYQFLQGNAHFSVSIPFTASLDTQLEFYGSKSGRDVDKYKECPLSLRPGQTVLTPVIAHCALIYECEIAYAQPMATAALEPELRAKYYQDQPPHTFFYGLIRASYLQAGGK